MTLGRTVELRFWVRELLADDLSITAARAGFVRLHFGDSLINQILPAFQSRHTELCEPLLPCESLQLVGYRRPLWHKCLPVVQQVQYLAALFAPRHDRRELSSHQQIQDRLLIPNVILVSRQRNSTNHSRIAYQEPLSTVRQHLIEPTQTPFSLRADHRLATS